MTGTAVIIPFRDRGTDPHRRANLDHVLRQWYDYKHQLFVQDDGRSGMAQFNRSAAYNLGAATTDADVLVYAESDVLIGRRQVDKAIEMATEALGMVVPYTRLIRLNRFATELVRSGKSRCVDILLSITEESNNYGCVNVLSQQTLAAAGRWDESFEGNGHDDCAMWIAFNVAAGPTRWVDGPAYHLYHEESIRAEASLADKAATQRNYRRMQLYTQAKTADDVRRLTAGAKSLSRGWRLR